MDEPPRMVGRFTLTRDESDRLILTDEAGNRYAGVQAVRAFPVTDPQHAISICDRDGRELVYLDALADVPPEFRALLEMELAQREFVPVIRRILNNPLNTEPSEWKVETDRGVTVFQLESETDLHCKDNHPVTIVDSHGIRYLIPDPAALDAHSRRVLERFL